MSEFGPTQNEYANWKMPSGAPETSLSSDSAAVRHRPGDTGRIRPSERRPGQWVGSENTPVTRAEAAIEDSAITGNEINVDIQTIQQIIQKCTQRYEGKYSEPLFGVTVKLNEKELQEITALLASVDSKLSQYTSKEPAWQSLTALIEERRKLAVGNFMEEDLIVSDGDIATSRKILINNTAPGIATSEKARRIFLWKSMINTLKDTMERYQIQSEGRSTLYGVSARKFGESIRLCSALYRDLRG